jgi:DNA-binding transcriptional LysR family regulator
VFGRLHVLPSITRFLEKFPQVDIRVQMMDRPVSLIDEGQDVGVWLGHLADSSLRAVRVGQVHLAVFASPDYLARRGTPKTPYELGHHSTISCAPISPIMDRWSFDGTKGVGSVEVRPRLIVSSADAAADAAASGLGITHILCYLAAECVAAGSLVRILTEYEPPPIPIHVVHPAGNFVPARVRQFVDHIAHDLRLRFANN